VGGRGSRRDHDRFCRVEGWELVRDARGGQTGHHITYRLRLPDGRVLRTRVSRPADGTTYGPRLWAHILRDQLLVSEHDYWTCVTGGVAPSRGAEPAPTPATALPAGLVHQLLRAGVPEAVIADMTLEEAISAMSAHWSQRRE
jgi:hypothetical protein